MMAPAAPSDAQPETDALEEEFFSTPPAAYTPEIESWVAGPMSAGNHFAMKATLAMLGSCALATLMFAAFSEHVFVFPAPLTAAHAQLPIAASPTPTAPPAPARSSPAATPASASPPVPPPALAPSPALAPAAALAPPPALAPSPARSRTPARAIRRPRATPAASTSPADALVTRAYRELAQGQPREARQLANQAIHLDPTHARAYIVLGGACDALGDAAGMRAAFRACVQHARGPLLSTCKTLAR